MSSAIQRRTHRQSSALEDGVFPAEASTYRRIRDEAARLSRLVEDLSALARAESTGAWARDAVRLDRLATQAVDNLLDNALRHTPPGGRVTVRLQATDGLARLAVMNTGHGITPEDLPHIFERFYRGDESRARTTGGAGIGLTLVKHIVERHGGRVGVESSLGQGSVFTLEVPEQKGLPIKGIKRP